MGTRVPNVYNGISKLVATNRHPYRNMTVFSDNKENNKESIIIYSIIFIAIVCTEIFLYKKEMEERVDLFSIALGVVGWFGMYMSSQTIIRKNLFRQFTYLSIALFVLCIIKQLIVGYVLFSLLASLLPLIFIGYFRLLIELFFKGYPNITERPIIIFGSKTGTHFEGDNNGYIPTMKEKTFGLLLFMGFMGFIFCLTLLLKTMHVIL